MIKNKFVKVAGSIFEHKLNSFDVIGKHVNGDLFTLCDSDKVIINISRGSVSVEVTEKCNGRDEFFKLIISLKLTHS